MTVTRELFNWSNREHRGHGLLILTRCSNGARKGTRLELYASTHDDCPVEIHDRREALQLAGGLLRWTLGLD